MRPVTVTAGASPAESPVIPIDQYNGPTNIALGVVVTGTITYTVQHTFDDVFSPTFNPATAIWFSHPILVGLLVNADSNYAAPPRGVRIITTAGTGSVSLRLVQSGISG